MLVLAAVPAWPQAAGGLSEISGTVHDASGATVPDAQVVIANDVERRAPDSEDFRERRLRCTRSGAGARLRSQHHKQGFAQYDLKEITLAVGQNLNIVAPLAVAGTATTVRVEAEAPLVDDTKTDVSQVIDTPQIDDLPVNGRRYDNFALLAPGVTADGTLRFAQLPRRGQRQHVPARRQRRHAAVLSAKTMAARACSRPSRRIRFRNSRWFRSNFSAEYGRATGGVVNTVTRSGTNDLHGSLYWFYRNQEWIAHDPFANINPNQWRVQSGASIGGALIKNKLFYLFQRRVHAAGTTPIVDSYIKGRRHRSGEPGSGSAAALPRPPAQCSAINALLPRFFGEVPRTVDQDLGFGRLDYHMNDRNTLSASFNFMWWNSPNGLQNTLVSSTSGAGVNSNGNDFARVRNGKLSWISVPASNFVNEFRYGLNTDFLADTLNPGLNGALGLLGASVDGVTLGAINYLPRVEPNETRNEFTDNATWTKSRHIVKFGVDLATTNDFSYYVTNINGSYTYKTPTAFAEDFTGDTTGAKDWKLLHASLRCSQRAPQHSDQRLRFLRGRPMEGHGPAYGECGRPV